MSNPEFSSLKEKISAKLQDSNNKKLKKSEKKKSNNKNPQDDILRNEALSLGATENDLELVQGLSDNEDASEQEFDEAADADTGFEDDLQKFIKNIGLNKNEVEIIEEPEKDVKKDEDKVDDAKDKEEAQNEDEDEDEGNPESDEDAPADVSGEESSEEQLSSQKEKDGFVAREFVMDSNKLTVPYDTQWYDVSLDPAVEQTIKDGDTQLTAEQIEKLYSRGKEALDADNATFQAEFVKESSRRKFMSQILSNGTLNDKISALTLLIQESPVHNLKSLETLVGFCNKKSRTSVLQSVNALKDLFVSGLLPDRKLRHFKNQPGLSMMLNKRTLAIFYFEDFLKRQFFNILECLEKLTHDAIIYVRSQTITHIFDLLTAKPEQEFNLLRLGVNKLGDIDSKISSKASYQLLKLQQAHPNMKSVIIDAIVDIALRPSADYHTTYYSTITLNQTILKRTEDDVANKLIKTYFTLFEKFLISSDSSEAQNNQGVQSKVRGYESKRKGNVKKGKHGGKSEKNEKTETDVINEKNSKMFSALLTGVNRAFPFAVLPSQVYETHLGTLFKITHSSNFNTCVQALVLVHQIVTRAQLDKDRYYRTLYESLLDARLVSSSKQGIYLNLLYKSLKEDVSQVERVEAFVKRILQVCSHWLNVGTVSGFFFLLLQLVQDVPQIRNLLINTPTDSEYQSDQEETEEPKKLPVYDSRKRDPKYAHADTSSLWEIIHFTQHYHPTVQTYVNAFLENDLNAVGKPDLGLFTLAHFLDRFVYRNAKQKTAQRGTSIMQPLFGGSQLSNSLIVRSSDRSAGGENIPVNAENWLDKRAEQVRPDEKFFYKYFTTKQKAAKSSKKDNKPKTTAKGDEDEEDLDEDQVWSALVKSQPDIEGDSSDGGDDMIGFSDMDSDDGEEEEELEEEEEEDEGGYPSFDENDEEDLPETILSFGSETEIVPSDNSDDDDEKANDENLLGNAKRPAPKSDEKGDKDKKQNKKRRLKELPLFASVDDYAHLLK
ncbi:hypothetical protein ZYGR_0AD02960 [Zygosaccharomyces rouxii]|uniref:ZYRO0G12892p n=2 Tax=Zygosaccharomyces rouxii TaxID=4956 RepID=C5E0I0_ZYGRC|nr:uncharacterized protein ZYRO0G12892g [Zygosaccharomyces rouxii]KAH9202607.1 CBF/Mak21 family-domain-containing protein [Zygosaccharomyces rouxii]GAV51113.1 hypothetical protein ZYGR_0AD02960 [Zygosaccharomyces rouxii]CAR29614.1 ZYRO0G12892p [Zygosaccharomyces rouxii]